MMRYVDIYTGSNSLQRSDTGALLGQHVERLQWGRDERVLDVGCGPGDVSAAILMPLLPPDASLCGVDLSGSMVEHANKVHSNERLSFKVVDFGSSEITKSLPEGHFTKIFSFYCLHWIHNQSPTIAEQTRTMMNRLSFPMYFRSTMRSEETRVQVVSNIRSLLRPSGQALLIIMSSITGMTAFKMLEQMEEWKPYMKDIDRIISPYYDIAVPSEEMKRYLSEEGLQAEICEDRTYQHTYPSLAVLIDSFMAVNPYVGGVPDELQAKFRSDTERLVTEHSLCERLDDERVRIEYKVLVVLCRKPGGCFIHALDADAPKRSR